MQIVPINQTVNRERFVGTDLLPTQAYGFGTHDSIVRTYTVQTGPRVLLWYTVFTIFIPFPNYTKSSCYMPYFSVSHMYEYVFGR